MKKRSHERIGSNCFYQSIANTIKNKESLVGN